jgi:hypothetical protein
MLVIVACKHSGFLNFETLPHCVNEVTEAALTIVIDDNEDRCSFVILPYSV